MRELWIDTWRSIVAHRVRFGLTALGIAWGAFMLTFLSSATKGFEQHFVTEFEEIGPRVVFMGTGVILKEGVGERGARELELEAEDIERATLLSKVEGVTPEIGVWAMPVRSGRRSKLMRIAGMNAEGGAIRNIEIERGRFLSPLDIERRSRVAVLGPEAAERLFDGLDPIGRSIIIDGYRFRVIGTTIAKGEQLMNSNDPDDLKVIVPFTTAQRWLTMTDVVKEFTFAPERKEEGDQAVQQIRELMALREGYDPSIESALWSFNIQEPLAMIGAIFLGMRLFMFGAGLVTLFVGAVGVMNIMLVVVGERTQEIGVRKAIGARGRDIFVQFLAEATVVSAASGLLGAGLGIALVQLVGVVMPEGSAYQSPPAFDPLVVSVLTFALIGVGIVSGAIPAIRAAQTPPAEALRAI
jgi:putative ABC transport system permease protein